MEYGQILAQNDDWPRRLTRNPRAARARRPVEAIAAMTSSNKRIAFGADQPSAFRVPRLRVFLDFLSNAKVCVANSGHGLNSSSPGASFSISA